MKKMLAIVAIAGSLAACTAAEERTLGGAAIGAGAGAVVGGLATGSARGAAVGAAIGGVGGAAVGASTAPRRDRYYRGGWCRDYDRYGNPVRVRC